MKTKVRALTGTLAECQERYNELENKIEKFEFVTLPNGLVTLVYVAIVKEVKTSVETVVEKIINRSTDKYVSKRYKNSTSTILTAKELETLEKAGLIKYWRGSFIFQHYMINVKNTQTNGKGYNVAYIYDESEDVNQQWQVITKCGELDFTYQDFTKAIMKNAYKTLPQLA